MIRNTSHPCFPSGLRALLVAIAFIGAATLGAQSQFTSWPTNEAPPELHPAISRADLIIVGMQDSVLRELNDALSRGGPASAISFCHLDATFLAQRVGKTEGIAVGRTSDRLRNPTNAPRPWAVALVKANAGKQARSIDGFAVDLGDKVGVLRPIAERAMCAGCHGPADTLSPEVKTTLADSYPVDRAVGYKEGEIRGWFWVEMPKRLQK
jgi:Protein of unknown function (DUF3365)